MGGRAVNQILIFLHAVIHGENIMRLPKSKLNALFCADESFSSKEAEFHRISFDVSRKEITFQ